MVAWWIALAFASSGSDTVIAPLPRFVAPGHTTAAAALTTLFRRHDAGTLPKATLWDAWLVAPSLWPAGTDSTARRDAWRTALLGRNVDDDGYVATHQHGSIAHPTGWPFPFWNQGSGIGWHFSFDSTVDPPWRSDRLSDLSTFDLVGHEAVAVDPRGIRLTFGAGSATLTTPAVELDVQDAPFIQVRAAIESAAPVTFALEWIRSVDTEFAEARAVTFAVDPGAMRHIAVRLDRHPAWTEKITRLRLRAIDAAPGDALVLQALFSQYDTRHNVNNSAFVIGCADYLAWTGDSEFLATALPRLRRAIAHLLDEHGVLERGFVRTSWIGHDGRSGLAFEDGVKRLRSGHGVGSNYWDLLPFGHDDAYATNYAHAALLRMAEIEDAATERGLSAPSHDAQRLRELAARTRAAANERFFSPATGRFVGCIDAAGIAHDYGFTFLNTEAIALGVANEANSRAILDWLDGAREVDGDTSRGADVYAFRFGPRATTRRNVEWYGWFWSGPESIPFGGQVQDGGAVLGFSYFDVMARLRTRGADDGWRRLQSILAWSDEVEAAGGYREFYATNPVSTLQGCGTAGGLGLDCEFFESALVAQTWLDGFVGFRPRADGTLELDPHLPRGFDSLGIEGIHFRDCVLDVSVDPTRIVITHRGGGAVPQLRILVGPRHREEIVALLPGLDSIVARSP